MCRVTLIRQLADEFMHDPAFKYTQVFCDVEALSKAWLSGTGRHFPLEDINFYFHRWWQNQFESLIQDSSKYSYTEFMAKLKLLAQA